MMDFGVPNKTLWSPKIERLWVSEIFFNNGDLISFEISVTKPHVLMVPSPVNFCNSFLPALECWTWWVKKWSFAGICIKQITKFSVHISLNSVLKYLAKFILCFFGWQGQISLTHAHTHICESVFNNNYILYQTHWFCMFSSLLFYSRT